MCDARRDLQQIGEVGRYKGIIERWDSWEKIECQCRLAALWATEALLNAGVEPSGYMRSARGRAARKSSTQAGTITLAGP